MALVLRRSLVAAIAAAFVLTGAAAASASPVVAPTVRVAVATQAPFTPKISGSATVGVTLKITGLPKGTTLSYRWKRNGVAISGATRSTYKIVTADLGKKLTVTVTSKRSGYTTRTKTSAATSAVLRPFATHTPAISGTARVGSTLKVTMAAWSPTPKYTYQWYRNGVAIVGATTSSRVLATADAGTRLTVKVTGTRSGYRTASKTSLPAAAVLPAVVASAPAAKAFPAGARVDYQLGGAYTPPTGVGIVTRDNGDAPAAGVWNICYINGFQTQPGESGAWPSTVILRDSAGKAVADRDWPGEYLLDTSTAAKRTAILGVLGPVIDRCASKGFQAVEFDNLDSYTRSGKLLVADYNIAMAKLLVDRAHSKGLLAGQKNTVELSQRLRTEAGFDFAVAEECLEWGECGGYTSVYGTKTLDVEYSDGSMSLDQVCSSSKRLPSTVYRDRDLVAKGQKGYVYGTCS